MDEMQEKLLHRLVDVFLEENAKINLSGHKTIEACWNANVRDSLPLLEIFTETFDQRQTTNDQRLTLIDIGTGGGFPLLPLAIALPKLRCMGLDATRKKVEAIRRIAIALNLSNVAIIAGRAEELGRDRKLREQFDIVTARAVAAIPALLEYCSPFARPGGHIVLWKSMDIEQELNESQKAQNILQCPFQKAHVYDLGEPWGKRQLLIFKKTGVLAPHYPRPVGVPGKIAL